MNSILKRAWLGSRVLMITGQIMLLDVAICVAGLALDSDVITGQPAWLKPFKFAVSVTAYCFTLAWILSYVERNPRLTRAIAWIISAVFVVEIVIIDIQAARGTTSHFNVDVVLDRTLFGIMGLAIGILWVCSMVVTWVLFRQRFDDPSWGWALKLGMLISVIGLGTGAFMVTPTRQQLDEAKLTHHMPISGSHTVGAPDGGPGLPLTGWSTEHGDLRVPHFLGMHAMQILPLIAWLTRRRRTVLTIQLAGAWYFGVFAILTVQALLGESLIEPRGWTFISLAMLTPLLAGIFWRQPASVAAGQH